MAFEAFLKIPGIEGDSSDARHQREVPVLTFSFGCTHIALGRPGHSITGCEEDRTAFDDLQVLKKIDCASPRLMLACSLGTVLPSVVLTVREPGSDTDWLSLTLRDALVHSCQFQGCATAGDEILREQVSFGYREIEFEHRGVGEQARTVACRFDQATGSGSLKSR